MNLEFISYARLLPNDHTKLLEIRNLKYVRKNMKNDSIIKINDHLSWINNFENDNTKIYYAVFSDNNLVGGVNITDINYKSGTSSWGLFMKENINPMIPSIATYLIIDKVFNTLELNTLNLEVNQLNINAYKFDKNFGFIDDGEYDDGKNSYYLMHIDKTMWEQHKDKGLLKIVKTKINNSNIKFNN